MTPAQRLLTAADLIETTGAKATPGPWNNVGMFVGSETDITCQAQTHADAAWIALLGPAAAPALGAWLRLTVQLWNDPGTTPRERMTALAFAALILRNTGGDA